MNKKQAYLEMKLTAGWNAIEQNMKDAVDQFTTQCLLGFKDEKEMEFKRGYAKALNDILIEVSHELSRPDEQE